MQKSGYREKTSKIGGKSDFTVPRALFFQWDGPIFPCGDPSLVSADAGPVGRFQAGDDDTVSGDPTGPNQTQRDPTG